MSDLFFSISPIVSLSAIAGFTFYVRESAKGLFLRTLLEKVPYTRDMLHCAFCTGFWAGILFQCVIEIETIYSSITATPKDGFTVNVILSVFRVFIYGYAGAIASRLTELFSAMADGLALTGTGVDALTRASLAAEGYDVYDEGETPDTAT